MRSYAKTDVGLMRQMNQDYIYANDEGVGILPSLYIVADGMGGHNAGDFASRFCVETFVDKMNAETDRTSIISSVGDALRRTNEELIVKSSESPDLDGMGTTFVAAIIDGSGLMYVANIGDSRLYLIHDGIEQITEDHSLVEEMVRNGDIHKDEARFHPKKNIVTRAISAAGVVSPDLFEVQLKAGDLVLLCSDGLSNMLSDRDIYDIVIRYPDEPETAVNELVSKANDNGGRDNISAVLIRYE